LRNTAKVEGIEKVGTVEKVEKENWKPPVPWVYSNRENVHVSNLESDIEDTFSSQGYVRHRGRRRKKRDASSPDYFSRLIQALPRFEFVKVYSDKLVSRTIITRILLGDLRYYIKIRFQDGILRACLIDTGSVSCCIGKHVVQKLRRVLKFRTINTKCSITGIDPSKEGTITERVFLEFILENNCILR